MKLKDSIIIILVFVIAIVIGVFAGVKFTEEKQGNNDINQDDIIDDNKNNNVNQDNDVNNENKKDNNIRFNVTTVDIFNNDGLKEKEIYVNGVTTKITYLYDVRKENLSYQELKDVLLIDIELDNTHRLYFVNDEVNKVDEAQVSGKTIRNIFIKDDVVTILSDNIGNSGCVIDEKIAKYTEEFRYLGNFKFSEATIIDTMSAEDYNKSQGGLCTSYVNVSSNEDIEDYLKENNISYVNPRENGQKVFDSSEKASNNFTLGTEDVTMTMYGTDLDGLELYIKINDKKIKVGDIVKYSTVYAYTYNNYLLIYTQFSGGSLGISIYDSSLNELISIDSDNNGVPLFSENFIYYGVKDCNGPSEFGDIAVYKVNLDTKEKTFLVYLKHDAGWAC